MNHQARNSHVVELEKEARALQEQIKDSIVEEARNRENRDKENSEREEREKEKEMKEKKEREVEVFETPSPSESQKNWGGRDSVSADKGERDTAHGNDEEKKGNSFSDVSKVYARTIITLCIDLYIKAAFVSLTFLEYHGMVL